MTVHEKVFCAPGAMLSPAARPTRPIPQVELSYGFTAPRRNIVPAVHATVPVFRMVTDTAYCCPPVIDEGTVCETNAACRLAGVAVGAGSCVLVRVEAGVAVRVEAGVAVRVKVALGVTVGVGSATLICPCTALQAMASSFNEQRLR